MHYKNGREVKTGDWVIGPTHNSHHALRIGRVLKLMPKQGSCNVQLLVFPTGMMVEHPVNGDLSTHIEIPWEGEPLRIGYDANDYADCKELIRVDDGWRMVNAVQGSGNWDSPYFPITMG